MDPLDTYPLGTDLTHKWDDETDTKIKASILSFLFQSSTKSAQEIASEIAQAFKPEHNISGFRDGVEDICIYTSKFLPANHTSQDRLIPIIEALRELPQGDGQPRWQGIFQTGSYLLIEAEGAQDLCRIHTDTPGNEVKRTYLRNLHAFMARLTREGISDCSYQALTALSQALETAEAYNATHNIEILSVYDWLRLAGRKLMKAEVRNTRVRGELWDKQKPGFSQERWMFWRKRLGDIEKDAGYESQAREVAGKAKDLLEQLMDRQINEQEAQHF